MHISTPNDVRRRLIRGLATGVLFTQTALLSFGQAVPAVGADAPAADETKDTTNGAPLVLEKFTVYSGFSGSLAAAAEAKQSNQAIVEVIMSEDIGKLPDISIADALTRLTGVTTQRTNGRSQAVYIRGFTPDFSTTTLNGREQASTALNRGVEFDQYPSELLNAVVVYKTASADIPDAGLAGTVDLETVRPLSKSGRSIAVSGYYQWTQLGQLTPGASKTGNRFNVSYVDQYDDGKVGLSVGYAHTSTPWEGQQFQAWGYPTDAQGNFALGGTKSYVRTSNLTRDGVMATLEFKPSKDIHSSVDFFYSKFKETQFLRGMEIPMAFWSSAQLQPGYTVTNGLITQSTLKNIQPVVRNDEVQRTDNILSVGWNLKMGERSEWPTVFDASYSRVKRKDENLETYSGLGFNGGAANPDTMAVTLIPGQIPVITHMVDYSNASLFKLTDPQGWGTGTLPVTGMEGYLKFFQSKDEIGQLRLTTQHELPKFFKNLEVGVNYTDRFKRDGEKPTGFIYNANGQPTAPLPPLIGTTDFSYIGLGRIYAYDPIGAYNNGFYGFFPNPNNDVIANRWNVTEKLTTLFAQFNIDSKMGGIPVTGNLGLQAVHADQSSSGVSATGSGGGLIATKVTGGATYTDFAPNLTLNFTVAPTTYVRLSLARQLARPRMYDMKAGRTFNYNSTYATSSDLGHSPWSGDGGNPQLRPWRSDSIDLSLEKYFKDNKGYIAISGFHKKLLTYIYQQSVLQDFTGYPITGGTTPVLTQGVDTTPVNGTGGNVQGVEATVSLPSELIAEGFKGFGVVLGGAYTDSSIAPYGPGNGNFPIAGLARKTGNITLYYEIKGFAVRVSERYRSSTREYITTFGAPNFKGDVTNTGYSLAQPEHVVDAQVSYALQSGPMKGLTFYLQAYNLNNEPLITYNNGDPRQVMNYQRYGASYQAGASYKF